MDRLPSGTTSETGQVKFTKLPAGKYRFVETEAPTGYDKDDLTFTDKDGNASPPVSSR